MTNRTFGYWLWGVTLGAAGAVAAILFFLACASPTPSLSPAELAIVAMAAECEKVINREIAARETCPEAELAIRANKACAVAFPAGINLDCKEHR